jgi:hypothetical protein
MSEHPPPAGTPGPEALDPLADRIERALIEATRDLKAFHVRELNAQQAQQEQRFEQRIAGVEAQLLGIGVKLVAVRDELHQSLRDQTAKLAILGMSALALAVAALLLVTRWWR